MTTHLNFFAPYQSLPAGHENQLTRALMVVLRYSPMAHHAWLRWVAPEHELQKLQPAEFAIQQERVLPDYSAVEEAEEIPGISVWLAPDAQAANAPVEPSGRRQILDAIISYGGDLVLVIENKIGWGKTTQQPYQVNVHGTPVRFDQAPKSVSWQEVLEGLADLVERNLVHGAERLLISDFLGFVEEQFPQIGPYSKLRHCGDSAFRIGRRLDVVQGLAAGSDKGKGQGWRDIEGSEKVFMAWLGYDPENRVVSLEMFPADTLGQARAFYADTDSVQAVLDLRNEGWQVRPNFHWGFAARGYAWCRSPLAVEAYCDYWIREIPGTREVARPEWDSYLARLEADGIVDQAGRDAFEQELVASQRQKVSARPGLFCEYIWSLPEATDMDDRGELVGAVRDRINQMLKALRAPELGGASSGS